MGREFGEPLAGHFWLRVSQHWQLDSGQSENSRGWSSEGPAQPFSSSVVAELFHIVSGDRLLWGATQHVDLRAVRLLIRVGQDSSASVPGTKAKVASLFL